jgi:hypothetical protein
MDVNITLVWLSYGIHSLLTTRVHIIGDTSRGKKQCSTAQPCCPAWTGHSIALPRQCHSLHSACRELIVYISQFHTTLHRRPHLTWPQDLLTYAANNWATLSLISSQQQFYIMQLQHQFCQPHPALSWDLPLTSPANKRTSTKPLCFTVALFLSQTHNLSWHLPLLYNLLRLKQISIYVGTVAITLQQLTGPL